MSPFGVQLYSDMSDQWTAGARQAKSYEWGQFTSGMELGMSRQTQLQDVMLKQYICSKNFVIANVWIGPKPATQVTYVYCRSKETVDVN